MEWLLTENGKYRRGEYLRTLAVDETLRIPQGNVVVRVTWDAANNPTFRIVAVENQTVTRPFEQSLRLFKVAL